jgi:hypothetical protein
VCVCVCVCAGEECRGGSFSSLFPSYWKGHGNWRRWAGGTRGRDGTYLQAWEPWLAWGRQC